jgi:DNA-binding FadR family transcriptional regulator
MTAQPPAYRILADRIASRILAGEIRPGDPLPTETVLSETYGVHRSTVREGIRLLEETGMLRRKSQKRLEVAVPDGSRLAERTAQALVLRGITVRALYEANLAFDPVLARIAAASASSAQITRLHRNLRQTRAAAPAITTGWPRWMPNFTRWSARRPTTRSSTPCASRCTTCSCRWCPIWSRRSTLRPGC